MRFFLPLSMIFALLCVCGCESSTGPDVDRPVADDPAGPESDASPEGDSGEFSFDFTLPSTTGETVSKADFAGKVLVVDIWGTWCPPCRAEVPHFVELQEELGPMGLQIVGINYEGTDSPEEAIAEISAFTETTPINYPLLLGTEEVKEQVPGFQGYPTTIFIDRTGKVKLSIVGARSKQELKGIMEKLLSEGA